MPQLYVLRRFSSWSFRLGMSVALLVSSAGLAASLLVSTAMHSTEGPGPSWPPAPSPAQAASGLRSSGSVLPELRRGSMLAYAFTSGTVAGEPASTQWADQPAHTSPAPLAPAGSFKTTMQRSWDTFKLAFR